MKIALYGGAFNPVHNEHVNIVKSAVAQLQLDKVVIIPTFISPHKKGDMTARGYDRLEMCRKAFENIEIAEVSDCELKRGGVSYSYVTCRQFKKMYPEDELYFIIGADMLESFQFWKLPEEILKCVTLAVCAREDGEALKKDIKKFRSLFKKDIVQINYVGGAIGSTRIRALCAVGEDVTGLVPEKVKKYLSAKKLYQLPELWGVKKYLTKERWQHTVGVVVCAAQNARRAGVYEIDAITAAAFHDCAKYLGKDAEELKGFECPKNVPAPVVHQYSGAYVAENTFGIKDKNILNAIRYHTSGRENMCSLEKLIYLSDLLEEGRDFEGVNELRKIFSRDINLCLKTALERQIERLKSTGGAVYPLSQRALNYLKENYDK